MEFQRSWIAQKSLQSVQFGQHIFSSTLTSHLNNIQCTLLYCFNSPENTLDFEDANNSAEAINSLAASLDCSYPSQPNSDLQIFLSLFSIGQSHLHKWEDQRVFVHFRWSTKHPARKQLGLSETIVTGLASCPSLMSLRHTNATSPHQRLIQLDHHFEITGTLAKK